MDIFKTKSQISGFVADAKKATKTIGFVPTMGALHKGHLSLVAQSVKLCDITIASVFVNPTQFNDKNDLANYPRTFDADCELLKKAGCNAVFAPSDTEMYPEPDTRVFNFNGLDNIMEGLHRPGHFNGVAQIVSKLFDIVNPDKAFFGLKDFQQVAIIRNLTKQMQISTQIVACPIIRESDGLAMSSRNTLLTPQYRQQAPIIYKTISEAAKMLKTMPISNVKNWVVDSINNNPLFKVEYFEIVDFESLKKVDEISGCGTCIACIAVWAGKIRLIDNIIIN